MGRFDAIPQPPRRPCDGGRFAVRAGAGDLKVPFARCGDGIARHVSVVTGRAQGPFHCLGCEERLTLRQPVNKRRHFAHRPDSHCTGETALHRYAKELLALRRRLTLPALVLHKEGVMVSVFDAGRYDFDEVHPEYRMNSFQPDAVVRYRGVDLAVEFLVNHAVDAEKRAKVRERDISMVEIDLSGVNAGTMDADELDSAILHTAPRKWIHHRKSAAAQGRLDSAVAAKLAERGAKLRGHILRKRRAPVPQDWKDEAMPAVRRAELESHLGLEAEGRHWFTVSDRFWQAEALYRHIIKPCELYTPGGRCLEVKGEFPNERDLSSKLPRWMIRTDLSDYGAKRLGEAGFSREAYGSAHSAVWVYFANLASMGRSVFWSREDQCFYVEQEFHGMLHRRVELHRIVTRLLRAAEIQDCERAYRAWARSFRAGGGTPADLAQSGGEDYRDLVSRLARLETMVSGYTPKVVDDLCNLPLEAIQDRNEAAIAAEEAKRLASLQQAAAGRVASIRSRAYALLEGEAAEWLARRIEGTDMSLLDHAGESEAALAQLERRLAQDSDTRQHWIATERRHAQLRGQLSEAAKRAFPTSQLAELFLNSGHPRLGGSRPIDRCQSEQDLAFITGLMAKKK
jgi:hypothetical protein